MVRYFIPVCVSIVAVFAYFWNISLIDRLGRSPLGEIASAVKSFTGIDYEGRVSTSMPDLSMGETGPLMASSWPALMSSDVCHCVTGIQWPG